MPIILVDFDLSHADQRLYQSVRAEFVDELRRGRRQDQIHFVGNRCFISTPETIYEFVHRLIKRNVFTLDQDRIVIVDESSRKMCVFGGCDMQIFEAFESYELIDISAYL